MVAPCKDCKDRHIGCHSRCPKYLSYKRLNDKARDTMHNENHLAIKPYIMKKKTQRDADFLTREVRK